MEICDLYSRIDEMIREIEQTELKLKEAFTKAIYEAACENPKKPKQISKHIFVIKFSDLIGNPWNTEFYNWESSAKILQDYLNKSNVKKWKALIEEIYNKRQGEFAFVPRRVQIWYNMYRTEKVPIPAGLIKKIIEKL